MEEKELNVNAPVLPEMESGGVLGLLLMNIVDEDKFMEEFRSLLNCIKHNNVFKDRDEYLRLKNDLTFMFLDANATCSCRYVAKVDEIFYSVFPKEFFTRGN